MTTYDQKVTEARGLVRRTEEDQWRLAELTWRALHEDDKSTREWADDIDMSKDHVSRLARIWESYNLYPRDTRPKFADAYAESKGMPVDRQERREMEAASNLRKAAPERKREMVHELLDDPEVLNDPGVRARVTSTPITSEEIPEYVDRVKNYERTAQERSAQPEFHPIDELIVDVTHLADKARHILKVWSGRQRNWDADRRELYLREVDELQTLRHLAQTEEGIDAELASIVEGSN